LAVTKSGTAQPTDCTSQLLLLLDIEVKNYELRKYYNRKDRAGSL